MFMPAGYGVGIVWRVGGRVAQHDGHGAGALTRHGGQITITTAAEERHDR